MPLPIISAKSSKSMRISLSNEHSGAQRGGGAARAGQYGKALPLWRKKLRILRVSLQSSEGDNRTD